MPGHEQQRRGDVERRADAVGAEDPWRRERTIESARGLPNRACTPEAFTATEQRQLFPRTWMFVAPASDVPEPGDIRPVDAAGAPLLLVRRENGEIRVFHNVCPHRGARLVSDAQSGKSALTCPYTPGPSPSTVGSGDVPTSTVQASTIESKGAAAIVPACSRPAVRCGTTGYS